MTANDGYAQQATCLLGFPGIMIQTMLVIEGFWKLRCWKIMSKTYSTSQ